MRRRDFITLLSGTAAWPLAAHAQQPDRVRRIGVFVPYASDDQEGHARMAALQQGLQDLGWVDGRNVRIDTRWGACDADRYRQDISCECYAAVRQNVDKIFAAR